ncbi:MAG: lipopolysaccharide biosynthesis protein [Acidobacteria bacterium]|nr:MAG: lipopolysaccharide biosynthesis protein [Acidobacteriota bacterium]
MKDLKHKVIRGGIAKAFSQAASLILRMGSLMVLARLLVPKDFGLVGMVTAFTGVLNLFRDFGLSSATVQRGNVTDDQISTLFWINILVGSILGLLLAGMSPFVAAFYHEPRLVWVSIILATSFIFNAAGVQHTALLERQMRFTALATIDLISLAVSTAIGIGMAATGFGYWSLVTAAVALPLVTTFCLWLSTRWVPGRPRSQEGVHSLLRFGGTLTLGNVIVYLAYNLEKVLLGRFWGADALGLYGRAYQLINLPTDNLNSAFWGLAFSGLSRVRDDAQKFKNYFLKGYSLLLALTIPMTIAAALFAPDLILVVLGPRWKEVVPIFRLLTPTILVFALINPLAWLIFSLGMVGRNLRIVAVLAPLVIAGYAIGLPYGPKGVAIGYSAMMTLWALPHIAWCVHGTGISLRDILLTATRPMVSGIVAAMIAFGVQLLLTQSWPHLARLVVGVTVLLSAYVGVLFYVMGQKAVYWDLFQGLRGSSPVERSLVSA